MCNLWCGTDTGSGSNRKEHLRLGKSNSGCRVYPRPVGRVSTRLGVADTPFAVYHLGNDLYGRSFPTACWASDSY